MTTVSSQVYYDASHLQAEQVLFDGWVVAALSSQLSEPSTMWVADLRTQTVLLVRGEDGVVRAFENSCVHRGTQIQAIKTGRNAWRGDSIDAVQCGYHGWKYSLKGVVTHIPKPKGIQCTETTLRQFAVYEDAGFIWVSLKEPQTSASEIFAPISDAVRHYRLEEMEPVEARDFRFPVNWKIALENALDYYHVSTVHPKLLVHTWTQSRHFQIGVALFANIVHCALWLERKLDRHCARHRTYSDHELSSLHKYFVFPNLVINVLPYHLTVMQFFPVGPTECIMRVSILSASKTY